MGRAYICVARTDLVPNELQVLDLAPNTSQNIPAYNPAGGQTGYLSHLTDFGLVATTVGAGGIRTVDVTVDGLSGYLIDNVEDVQDGNITLSDADALAATLAIWARVGTGSSLTLAAIDGIINTVIGGAPNSGLTTGNSTGSVEEILRLLSGEVYRLDAGAQVADAANAFPVTGPLGYFLEAPIPYTAGPAGGGRRFLAPLAPAHPAQVAPHSWDYRDIRHIVETPDLWRSVAGGTLHELAQTTYRFYNPKFAYGVTVGPTTDPLTEAVTLAFTAIADVPSATAYIARGVTVYDATGNVITI